MSQMKRMLVVLLLAVLSVVFVACTDKTTTTSMPTSQTTSELLDTEAPVITIANTTIMHQTGVEVSLTAGVSVTDNVSSTANISITIDNYGGYDRSVAGTYTVTVKATDEAGNFSTKTLTVIVKDDVLAPMLTGANLPVTHLAGEETDLTKGLTAVDNVDGTNVTFTVSSYGDYLNGTPGTYTIQITMTDSSGNTSAPISRQIIVEQAYARAEMTSFAGDIIRQPALYNPQVLNGNTGTSYNSAYDGHYVNVLSKDYLEWLIEYAPDRFGSGIGWSVIAVTDADNKIVYVRHWSSGEAYLDNEGNVKSVLAEDWSTGSNRTWTVQVGESLIGVSNAKYSSGEMGLMLANINRWVPENGHVFMFMNWATIGENENGQLVSIANSSSMPRSMGANYIMNSDENGDDIKDYALGRTLEIKNAELSSAEVRDTFDPENPFPVISIPYQRYLTDTGIWKNRYEKKVYLSQYTEENPYNPLDGITANDGKGNDISDQITYKIYRYKTAKEVYGLDGSSLPITHPLWAEYVDTPWVLSENEVTLQQILNAENNNVYYTVEYTVTANGKTDTAYSLIKIQSTNPDYLELYGPTDTAYSRVMGIEQRLVTNPNFTEFGPLNETERGMFFTGVQFHALTTLPVLNKGVVVVLNNFYQVQLIRFSNGLSFEMDKNGVIKSSELNWTAEDLLANLKNDAPLSGYVIVYPEGLNASVMNKAFKAYYNFDYDGSVISAINQTNGMVEVQLPIKEVQEVSSLVVNDTTVSVTINNLPANIQVVVNNLQALVFSSSLGGAGFRTDIGKAYLYTKDMYTTLSADSTVVNSFTTLSPNKGVPWFRDGVLIILDAEGNFVSARVMTTTSAAEVFADGTVIFGNAAVVATSESVKAAAGEPNLTWDLIIPNAANTVPHGPLMDIMTVVPNGGSFIILPASKTADIRNYGIGLVWNHNYPGAGAIADVVTDPELNIPDTLKFDSTTYTQEYFTNLKIEAKLVSSIVAQSPKLPRPVVTITENIASWNPITGAASYKVVVNGVVLATVTDPTIDLKTIINDSAEKTIQVRAITADAKTYATSVLSDAVKVKFASLTTPTNLLIDEDLLLWDAVDSAVSYNIFVNDVLVGNTTEISFDLSPYRGSAMKRVEVQALASSEDALHVQSSKSETIMYGNETTSYLTLGTMTQHLTYTNVAEWLVKRNITVAAGGFSGSTEIFYIEDAFELTKLADQTGLITANGTMVLFSSTGQVKAVRTVLNNHEWLSTNDPLVNNGWTIQSTYTSGQVKISQVTPYIALGDYIIVTNSTTAKQAGATLNPRDFLAYHFMGTWDTTVASNEIWRKTTFETFINPSTAVAKIKKYEVQPYLQLTLEKQHVTYTSVAEWLYKRNVTMAEGGFASSNEIFYIEDAFELTKLADQTGLLTANGTMVLFSSTGQVKAVRTVLNNHEWLSTNDPLVNNGWTINSAYASGKVVISQVTPFITEGDYIVLTTSGTSKQLGATLNARDFLAYHFMGAWDTAVASAEIWRSTTITEAFVNPSTVSYSFVKVAVDNNIILSTMTQHLTYTNVAEWLVKRNVTVAAGGFSGSTEIFYIEDAFELTKLADQTGMLTVNGMMVLFSSTGQVKAVRTVLNNHEWLSTNDQLVNNGWTIQSSYVSGQVKISQVTPYISEGDYIIITTNTTAKQVGATLSPRDFIAYHFMGSWDTTVASNEIWRKTTFETFINPTTTVVKVVKLPVIF